MIDPVRAGRLLFLLPLAFLTWRFMADVSAAIESFLHLPNLVFHEAGHILFIPLGQFMTVLGGSLLQVIVPLVCAGAFILQHDNRFGCAVSVWWAGQSVVDLAPYIADARALRLPLIGGRTGAEVEGHDWEYLLGVTGLLHWDVTLGRLAHFAGSMVMVAALAWAVALALKPNPSSGR